MANHSLSYGAPQSGDCGCKQQVALTPYQMMVTKIPAATRLMFDSIAASRGLTSMQVNKIATEAIALSTPSNYSNHNPPASNSDTETSTMNNPMMKMMMNPLGGASQLFGAGLCAPAAGLSGGPIDPALCNVSYEVACRLRSMQVAPYEFIGAGKLYVPDYAGGAANFGQLCNTLSVLDMIGNYIDEGTNQSTGVTAGPPLILPSPILVADVLARGDCIGFRLHYSLANDVTQGARVTVTTQMSPLTTLSARAGTFDIFGRAGTSGDIFVPWFLYDATAQFKMATPVIRPLRFVFVGPLNGTVTISGAPAGTTFTLQLLSPFSTHIRQYARQATTSAFLQLAGIVPSGFGPDGAATDGTYRIAA